MNKGLKWFLIIFGAFMVLFLAVAIIVPAVFKDDIKAMLEKEVAKSVNADVVFGDFNLSFFSNFPNITAGLDDLGVMNREPFAGEMLFATEKFEVEVNLVDILFSDALKVKGISLIRPVVNVKVLKDGRANYDIAMPSADTTTVEESGEFSFGIDHWEIVDGDVTYDDQSTNMKLTLNGLNHSGSGDFTQDVFDMKTRTVADSVSTSFEGVEYLTHKEVEIDATLNISEDYSKYVFKDNKARFNDFAMHVDGWVKMNENDIGMDLTFNTPENSFKSLLSLVPGVYNENFDDIRTAGDLSFNGSAKGTYSEKQLPAFNLTLLVKDAMFQYPDLPTPVNNINLDLLIDNKDGNIEHTIVDLKKMHMDFGSNPVDARARITRLYPTDIDATLSAKLNLGELNKMFPMDGLEMKGNYAIDLKVKGVYDSLKKLIPVMDANMSLADGYIKSSDFPIPMDDMHFTSSIKNSSGRMAETFIRVNDFSMLMDGEKLTADLLLQNLDNYTWDLKVNGGLDLEKITKIFPVEGMTLAGKVKANIQTKGNYADVEAERFERLPTSGTASLQDFKYVTAGLPEVSLSQASMVFDPKKIALQKMSGTVGKSDFNVTGSVLNYLGYVFGENEVIKGNVNFTSNLFDLNEFMSGEEEGVAEDTSSFSTIPVPRNIDFVISSNLKTVKLMDLTITNAVGDIIVKDGVANLNGLRFNMLGGNFVVNGTYNTKNLAHPTYDMGLKIDNMSIQEAANSFSVVKTFAPIAGLVNGKFSTDFRIDGELLRNMMPNMATVDGAGLLNIAQASLKDSKLLSGITSLTKLEDTDDVTLKDVLMSASIKDGKLSVKPFDVNLGNYKTTVSGSTLLDGTIDYNLKMDVPAGKLGTQFNSLLSKYSGQKTDPNNTIPVTIALRGKYDDPRPTLVMDEQSEQVKEAVKEAAKEQGAKAIEKAVKGTEAEKIVKDILGGKKDTTKTADTTNTTPATTEEAVKEKVEEEAKKKIQNLLKRKKN
ncbi:MAG: AsmA-like C-terminal region-containing protein [Cyclobacteriaceae bacterium]